MRGCLCLTRSFLTLVVNHRRTNVLHIEICCLNTGNPALGLPLGLPSPSAPSLEQASATFPHHRIVRSQGDGSGDCGPTCLVFLRVHSFGGAVAGYAGTCKAGAFKRRRQRDLEALLAFKWLGRWIEWKAGRKYDETAVRGWAVSRRDDAGIVYRGRQSPQFCRSRQQALLDHTIHHARITLHFLSSTH